MPFPISTHAPRTGSDTTTADTANTAARFQPTLPARGATWEDIETVQQLVRISTHAPRTGSDFVRFARGVVRLISTHAPRTGSDFRPEPVAPTQDISTHAPRTGSDTNDFVTFLCVYEFQPTLPARGATPSSPLLRRRSTISTHAPRTGSDPSAPGICPPPSDFNPRSPHGERH